jgi:hypothetical protein
MVIGVNFGIEGVVFGLAAAYLIIFFPINMWIYNKVICINGSEIISTTESFRMSPT